MAQHTSDILRGPPINDEHEPSHDYVAGGVTIALGNAEIDISHGYKRPEKGNWQTGSQVTGRWYLGRDE